MRPTAAADRQPAPHERLVVVRAPIEPEDELVRVSWPRTIARLALEPGQHPWKRGWKLQQRAPLVAVAAALALLLLFLASGCAPVPLRNLELSAATPAPAARGARCESVIVQQELVLPAEGELGDLHVTLRDVPPALGKLRVLVRKPRFPAVLSLDSGRQPFGKVLDVPAARELTLTLSRPPDAPDGWPRGSCKPCKVEVELTGLFGVREGMDAWFARAMKEASAIEEGFSSQAQEPASRPSAELLGLASDFAGEAARCSVPLDPVMPAVEKALAELDAARAKLYAAAQPQLPDPLPAVRAWDAASTLIDELPEAAQAARAQGWPASLRKPSAKLHQTVLTLALAAQAAALPPADASLAAQWIAVAQAPDSAALERRIQALPPVRDLPEAEARLDWVDPRNDVRLPGATKLFMFRVREWRAARHGRKCFGKDGAAPARDALAEAQTIRNLLHLTLAQPSDIPAARASQDRGAQLLCEGGKAPDVAGLFKGLDDKELGPVAQRLQPIYEALGDDELSKLIEARASDLLCKLFDPENLQKRVSSVSGYKIFVEGGQGILQLPKRPVFCAGKLLTAAEVRLRLRDAYRAALDQHAVTDRLCPLRSGKCPEETAASVRRLFSLVRPALAAPGEGKTLDYPPPFGFSDLWVQKLDRCAREACATLDKLRAEAPAGHFNGAVCPPRTDAEEKPQEITLEKPESPTSITLSSCDAHAGVRLTLRRAPDAGTLVSIASNHAFRYGSETISRLGKHPQLGRIYERVADLTDPGDVSKRADGVFEVALTPTVANQVFYFFSLRRRDY